MKMTNILTIVCYLMLHLQLAESLDKDKIHFSKRLQNANFYTFEWIIKVSIKDCVEKCKSTSACKYINYEVRTHKCALIRTNTEEDNESAVAETKPGYIFGNKSEWSSNKHVVCQQCADHGMCHIDGEIESDYKMCRNSGCKLPNKNNVQGNMYSTGGRIRQNCPDPNATFPQNTTLKTCAANGTWIHDDLKYCRWSYFDGSYYYIETTSMNWTNAKEHCESLFAHLLDINTEKEQAFIEHLLIGDYARLTWIGGNDLENEGEFQWSNGSPFSGYTNWNIRNPDNGMGSGENCVHLNGVTFAWNDNNCAKTFQSICEKEFEQL